MAKISLSWRRALAIAAVLLAVADGVWFWYGRAPRYEGKTAGHWVDQLLRNQSKAREALLAMGPRAVPALADAVGKKENWSSRFFHQHRSKLPAFIARRVPNPVLVGALKERAIGVLFDLGPAAAPAVPQLI